MKNVRIQYLIGKSSYTNEYPIQNNWELLQKQFSLAIPLITGVNIRYKKNKKDYLQKIYVGKEISLKEHSNLDSILNKYEMDMENLADIAVLGYDRACLLNFKKYDQVLVGVENNTIIVPDYYALKKIIYQIQCLQ